VFVSCVVPEQNMRVFAVVFVLGLCYLVTNVANAAENTESKSEPQAAASDKSAQYPYVKQQTVGVDLGRNQGFALPPALLFVVLLVFLGVVAFVVYKIFDMQGERARRKQERKDAKQQKGKKSSKKGSDKGSDKGSADKEKTDKGGKSN